MSIKLPESVPFNDPVTVCSACKKASCALQRFRCHAARRGPVGLEELPLAVVRAAAKENPSYWKPPRADGDDDTPIDVEDMEFLIRWTREQHRPERSMIAGYLEHELGIDPEQVAAAMAKEWPEASA